MSSVVLIVPGSIAARTGGYEYDRRIVAGLRGLGWTVAVLELAGAFPHPTAAELRRATGVLASIPDGTLVLADGLAYGAMPDEIERESLRLRFVPVVHMPLGEDSALGADAARELAQQERRALAAARLVVVTGAPSAAALMRAGTAGSRIVLVEPGTDRAPVARGSGDPAAVHLLCVATLNPGKGHDLLFRALASVSHRRWRLTCAGSLDRSPETVRRLRGLLEELRLADRVTLTAELGASELGEAYDRTDLFVLATRHESYGMAVAEALARGVPVVSTDTGAIAALVGDGGIVVPPGDQDAFAGALASAMDDGVRAGLAAGARQARERLAPWDEAVTKMAALLRRAGA